MPNSKKKINIIVETIEGESVEIGINMENKISHLMEKAMKELSIDPCESTYEMIYEGVNLDLDKKIRDYDIPDGGVVLLQRRPKVG